MFVVDVFFVVLSVQPSLPLPSLPLPREKREKEKQKRKNQRKESIKKAQTGDKVELGKLIRDNNRTYMEHSKKV